MRLRGSFFAQHAQGKGGAIVEPDDGDVQLVPALNLAFALGAPLFTTRYSSSSEQTTRAFANRDAFTGAQAASGVSIGTITNGIWVVDWQCTLFFSGTTDLNDTSRFGLVGPSGDEHEIFLISHLNGQGLAVGSGRYVFDLGTPGDWEFVLRHGTTIAGDTVSNFASALCQRVA